VSRLKRSLSGSLRMFAAMRRTWSFVMWPMESSGLAAQGAWPRYGLCGLQNANRTSQLFLMGRGILSSPQRSSRSEPKPALAYMPKRQFTPARSMFSFKVLRAPAPTHIHSPFALKFGVMPYSTPAPAARPG
jgi:hypothetical protein